MKFLPILILILLLAPVFVSAGVFGGLTPMNQYCGWDHPEYDPSIQPCANMCFRDYCIGDALGPGPCYELWAYADFCALKACCAVSRVTRWLYFIASGLALIVIVWAGIMYMTAGGDEEKTKKAKKVILYGLIGVLIVYASGYILSTVIGFLY